MEVIVNAVCFALGVIVGVFLKGEFTFNYRHTYSDESSIPTAAENAIGFHKPEEKPNEVADSPAEIASKIQEAIGVFVDE